LAEQIARVAARQHGVVGARQLYALGLSADQVAGRARAGWLHRVHRGVYAVGHSRLSRRGRWMAAVLACGPGAVLSHLTAALLWGLRPPHAASGGTRPIDVTIPTSAGRTSRVGIRIHRAPGLSDSETSRRDGLPVTSPARTILDLARVLPRRSLERAIDEGERLRLCGVAELEAIATVHSGQGPTGSAAAALAAVLSSHAVGSTLTRSELEERFLALCRERGLPAPLVNAPLFGLTVDFHWPTESVVVEVDGHESHGTRRAFQDDRDRDSLLAAHGVRTLRFTWWDVTARPAVVADRLKRVLGRR
jgi:hypothetical protein